MSNPINKEDAIEAVVCHIWHMPNEAYRLFNCENVVREVVEDAINRLPPVEVLEVVRCKDCLMAKERDKYTGRMWCCRHRELMDDMYYCADGLCREGGKE